MNRHHGNSRCDNCLQISPLGFLYACRQDFGHNEPENQSRQPPRAFVVEAMTKEPVPPTHSHMAKAVAGMSGGSDCWPDSTRHPIGSESPCASLESLGFSRSVVDAAEKGLYTPAQLGRLVAQKTNLHTIIALQSSKDYRPAPSLRTEMPDSTSSPSLSSTPRRKDSVATESGQSTPTSRIKLPRRARKAPKCKAKFCSRCRPYFKERAYLSFDAVFADEIEPLTAKDIPSLKIADANIVRNIGLHEPPSLSPCTDGSTDFDSTANQSHTTFHTTDTDIEAINQNVQLSKQFYHVDRNATISALSDADCPDAGKPGVKSRLIQTYYDVMRSARESSSDGSDITMLGSSKEVLQDCDEDAREFDLGLFNFMKSRDSQWSMRNPYRKYFDLDDREHVEDEDPDGDEVEVDGGVALTEEAVETHTPDIIAQA